MSEEFNTILMRQNIRTYTCFIKYQCKIMFLLTLVIYVIISKSGNFGRISLKNLEILGEILQKVIFFRRFSKI